MLSFGCGPSRSGSKYNFQAPSATCRYDPYGRSLTIEQYDQKDMRSVRRRAIERAQSAQTWGLVLGTLGRQGNPALVDKLEALLEAKGLEHSVILMSEVTPESLKLMPGFDAWIQVACPRCFPFSPPATIQCSIVVPLYAPHLQVAIGRVGTTSCKLQVLVIVVSPKFGHMC